ncbi:unnamed protein product, partial [Discosporangium mesarthrocarpum]
FTYLDTEDQKILQISFGDGYNGSGGLWDRGGFDQSTPGMDNPWKGRPPSAPYDQKFYLVINLAAGGVSGFFPDGMGGKMWNNNDSDAAMRFFENTDEWYKTWHGRDAALQVR